MRVRDDIPRSHRKLLPWLHWVCLDFRIRVRRPAFLSPASASRLFLLLDTSTSSTLLLVSLLVGLGIRRYRVSS